ncbi:MAG: hypothetical protein ABWQ14_09510, partial [Desulfovibrio aminophilus]
MNNLKLAVKLGIGFGTILVLTLAVAVTAYFSLSTVARSADMGDRANAIVTMILQARQIEKNFILRGDPKLLDDHKKKIAEIEGQASEAQSLVRNKDARDLLQKAGEQVKSYEAAFQNYVGLGKKKDELNETMRADGRAAQTSLQAMWDDQDGDVKKSAESNAAVPDLIDRHDKSDDAARLTANLLNMRRFEKEFIISGDPKKLEEHQAEKEKLQRGLPDLRSRYRKQKNIEAADVAIKGVNTYAAAFQEFAQLTQKQTDADKDMVDNARAAQKACLDALALFKADMASNISLANSFTLGGALVALVIGIAAALFLTRAITGPVTKGVAFAQ